VGDIAAGLSTRRYLSGQRTSSPRNRA